MQVRAGTSGFSYKPWKGRFYPSDLPDNEMLRYYAGRLDAVEVNNTFYRLPRREMLQGWAAQVPPTFRFALKANRRITHLKRLKDAGDETTYLLDVARALGETLGVVLYQLPPNLKLDLPRLSDFVAALPDDVPAAFEFRHESWDDDGVRALLAGHGAALCLADTDDGTPDLHVTAGFGYLRLRRKEYTDADLAAWAGRVAAAGWGEAYVFFKHEDEAAGPAFAERFAALCRSG